MAKVFWGVLLALLAFSAITTVLFFLGVIGFASAVNQAAEQNAQQVHAVMVAEHQAQVRQQQLRAFRQAEDLRRRTLGTDERCVAGTVIQIRGSSYTQQLGADGRPVACSGRYRLR